MSENQGNKKPQWSVLFMIFVSVVVGYYAYHSAYNHWFSAEAYYEKGNDLLKQGKKKEAIEAYTKAIERNPKFVKAYQKRAVSFIESYEPNKYDSAFSDCEKALEIDPNYMPALLTRGNIYRSKKDYNNALTDFNRVLEADSKSAEAFEGRARTYMALKDYKKAAFDYLMASNYSTNEVDQKAKRRRLELYLLHGDACLLNGDYSSALTEYTRIINNDKDLLNRLDGESMNKKTLSDAYFGRGYIYREQRDLVNAIENYTKSIEVLSSPAAYNNRGLCYADQGDYAQAVSDFTKAIEKEPRKAMYYNNRGNSHIRLGNIAQAEADFAKAKELEEKK